jgi:hypothetical protein
MFERAAQGQSGRHLKHWLDEIGFKTRRNKNVTLSQIFEMLNNPFYYGDFMFGGTLYKGIHEPLITKALFDQVQEQRVLPQKAKWGSKDFPFKRFLSCYSCGATIIGEEKFKKLKNGRLNRHVYYHCSRQVDYSCKEPYVREKVIIEELLRLVDKLAINRADCEPGLLAAINKYSNMMLATNPRYQQQEAFHGYARYVLQRGTDFERTRLVRNLKVKLTLHDRAVASA